MATVLITGGTGMIGKALTKELLSKGHEVIIFTRDASKDADEAGVSYAEWDLYNGTIDDGAIAKADAIVHLAGANLAEGRWTEKRKKEIIDSRVKSGELIVKKLGEVENKVKVVVSASAIGYYGADRIIPNSSSHGEGNKSPAFVETSPPANDFLGTVVQKWEAAIDP